MLDRIDRITVGVIAMAVAGIGYLAGGFVGDPHVQTLLTLLESPFDEHPQFDELAGFPPDWAGSIAISCSS